MKTFATVLLALLLLAGCRAKREDPKKGSTPASRSTVGGQREACPECGGTGACPFCGVVSRTGPPPGQCRLCILGTGDCPDCGGTGELADGRDCLLCRGSGRCPDCGGSGDEVFCEGSGLCPTCRGHGFFRDGRAVEDWPPRPLLLRDGTLLRVAPRERPGASLPVLLIRNGDATPLPLSLLRDRVEPLDSLLVFRLFRDPELHRDRVETARLALSHGDELLFYARRELQGLGEGGSLSQEVARLVAKEQSARAAKLLDMARVELRETEDPRRARVLLLMARPLRSTPEVHEQTRSLLAEAETRLAGATAGLDETGRQRRAQAEQGRLARALARSRERYRVSAEILSHTHIPMASFRRAERAARDSWLTALRAANRCATPDLGAPAREAAAAARILRVRCILGYAARLLDAGFAERARALGSRALVLRPGDEGATRFLAEVERVLGRGEGPR